MIHRDASPLVTSPREGIAGVALRAGNQSKSSGNSHRGTRTLPHGQSCERAGGQLLVSPAEGANGDKFPPSEAAACLTPAAAE